MVERGAPEFGQARSDVAYADPPNVGEQTGARRKRFRRSRESPTAPLPAPRSRQSRGRFSVIQGLRRLWIPLVILTVVIAGGFTVSRLHGIFGNEKRLVYSDTRAEDSKPFNPKHLRYEVFGAPGTVADISYFDVNGDPQHLKGISLPWSLEYAITAASAVGNVLAQGDSSNIGCRILVDNELKSEKTSEEVNAFTFCLLKSA